VTRDYIGDYHGREPWVKIPSYVEMIDIYEARRSRSIRRR